MLLLRVENGSDINIVLPARSVDEDDLPVSLEASQDSIVKLGVLANPGVAVVHVGGRDVLVRHVGQDNEPLLEELSAKPGNFRTF